MKHSVYMIHTTYICDSLAFKHRLNVAVYRISRKWEMFTLPSISKTTVILSVKCDIVTSSAETSFMLSTSMWPHVVSRIVGRQFSYVSTNVRRSISFVDQRSLEHSILNNCKTQPSTKIGQRNCLSLAPTGTDLSRFTFTYMVNALGCLADDRLVYSPIVSLNRTAHSPL